MTSACSASASVSVDLPASGWEITANVRRRAVSPTTRAPPAVPDDGAVSLWAALSVVLTPAF
ncbi:hypothetical protein GCM10025792_16040 [Pseudonocardia tropica]